ncbi:MAG: FAD-dependent oxidoreductase [Planctomycetaceae bacterium]
MPGASHTSGRIVIVGGGVAGLSIAARLAQSGLPITLLEAATLGFAASTRNQGWLHSGAWFAPEHPELAKLCHQSLIQTLQFCPDCIEPQSKPMAFLFARPDSERASWKKAWSDAGIPFDELPLNAFFHDVRHLDHSTVLQAFQLPDRAIRWDVLLERLAAMATNAGAEVRTETPVVRLLTDDGCVQGVATGTGEEIAARLVILAANAGGTPLWPGSGEPRVGEQSNYKNVVLKGHLIALKPEVSLRPFCVVDADGFSHLPHLQTSVFGIDDWQVVGLAADQQPEPERVTAIWQRFERFFPGLNRADYETLEWAGTTVQSLHVDQIEPGLEPRPTVINHAQESPRLENLISVFTGRATLWTHVAEETRKLVLDKIQTAVPKTASPPWDLAR